MAYRIPRPDASSRGRGRGSGFPPHPQGRRGHALRSAQGIYPICQDDETAVSFMEFIHQHGTSILQATGGPWAPTIYVSLIDSARAHIASTGSAVGVFRTDPQSSQQGTAKHFFPGFSIRFLSEHSFVDSSGGSERMKPRNYQGQFHWHNGQGRLTIDACSAHTSDGSMNPRFSAEFAFHSLPLILTPVINAWNRSRATVTLLPGPPASPSVPKHARARTEYLKIPETPTPPLDPLNQTCSPST
jgi:hypothetical protein